MKNPKLIKQVITGIIAENCSGAGSGIFGGSNNPSNASRDVLEFFATLNPDETKDVQEAYKKAETTTTK